MATVRRFRFWQKTAVGVSLRDALARAAAAGAPVGRLVELTSQSLLDTGEADRAGVWLRSEKVPGVLEGSVVDAEMSRVPESWKTLDAMHPGVAEMLASDEPLLLNPREVAWAAVLGPLLGMQAAAILPLHCAGESLGLALVAYQREPILDTIPSVAGIADHLAVTVSQRRLAARSRWSEDQRSAFASLEQSLAGGKPAESFLKQLAEVVRQTTGAGFVAVARRAGVGNGVSFAAFEGPAEIVPLLGEAGLARIWRAVVQDRRAAVENVHRLPAEGDWGEAVSRQGIALILVLPLEAGGELQGVLAVGLGAEDSPAALRPALEPFAALGAKVLWDDSLRTRVAASEATLSALLEAGSEMVLLLDAAGYIQQGSRAAREKLKFAIFPQSPPRLEEIFPERERAAVVEWREAAVGGSHPAPLELTLDRGTILRLRVQATLLPAGRWQAGLEDLTASRSAERQRKEVDAELAAVLDSMESGMLLFNARGGLRLANTRFAHLLGLEPRRLAEIADFEALLAAVRNRFREPRAVERRWREILSPGDEAAWDELEVLHPSRRVVERFARPVLNSDGERIGWLELYRDITGERLIQSKLLQAEKMAALGQLVSGIAHELNNPLTGIMGYAQLLLSRPLDGQQAAEAGRIFEEAERAGRIVKNLLLFAREKKPERKPVNLNEIIERTLALRSYELKVQNIAIVRELDSELPAALADAHQLQQVVLNLLVNAEQAIQQGSGRGRITVRTRRVSAMRMALEVSDDGPGIPPEIASRIFDPFFTTKPVGVGTGLGLSIVYGIVQEHGGEVTVDTHSGHGTRFVIELPMLPAERGAEAAAATPPRVPRMPAAARGRKILVIEDEPTVAQLVVDVLREEGHQAEAMLDSAKALERILRQHYDLVICDLRMPRLDGRDLYLSLVRHGSSVQHRIIFITGDTLTPHTLEFLERNSLRYLAKPFLVEELKRAVDQELEGEGLAPGRSEKLPRLVVRSAPREEGMTRRNERPGRSEERGPTLRGSEGSSKR